MPNKLKKNWGGKRKNSGAKNKYNEKTMIISIRCPLSKSSELKLLLKSKLHEWSKNKI